jgi:hypothetical protein
MDQLAVSPTIGWLEQGMLAFRKYFNNTSTNKKKLTDIACNSSGEDMSMWGSSICYGILRHTAMSYHLYMLGQPYKLDM